MIDDAEGEKGRDLRIQVEGFSGILCRTSFRCQVERSLNGNLIMVKLRLLYL